MIETASVLVRSVVLGNLWLSLLIFRKCLEMFGKGLEKVWKCLENFLENLHKFLKVVRNLQKIATDVIYCEYDK